MRKILVLGMALLMTLGLAGFAGATVIDFEDLVGSGQLPSGYAGLTWDPNWQYYDWSQPPYNPSSGNVRIYTHNYGGWIDFGQDVSFQGSWVASSDSAGEMFWEGYNDGVKVAESAHLYGGVQTWLNVNWASVDYVKFVCTSFDYFILDDIQYNGGAPVPIPGAVWLLGSGLVGLIGLRRKLQA
ncbi:MAG: VPLPA-CTERM sorting domain-containing protein [Thermodesulfobacteriota bacterium]